MALIAVGAGVLIVIRPLPDPYVLAGAAGIGVLAGAFIDAHAGVELPGWAFVGAGAFLIGVGFLRTIGFVNPFGSDAWPAFATPALAALAAARDLVVLSAGGFVGGWIGRELWGW